MLPDDNASAPQTVAAVISDLRNAISSVSPAALAEGLHRLGPRDIAHSRVRLSRAVASLRAAASARAKWGDAAESVCRVKTDAARPAEHVRDLRDALKECQYQARANDPFAPVNSIVLQRVKAAAETAGAQAIEGLPGDVMTGSAIANAPNDEQPGPLLTVCASTFLADFQFYSHDVAVHFRHLAGDTEICDEEIDNDFVRLVRSQNYQALQEAFATLVLQENLDASLRSIFHLNDSLRAFENDLLAMHAHEREVFPHCSSDQLRDHGHGLARRSASGLRITFAKDWEGRIGVESAYPSRKIISKSTNPAISSSTPRSEPPLSFQFSQTDAEVAVAAQFVFILESPLITSVSLAQELECLSDNVENGCLAVDNKDTVNDPIANGLSSVKPESVLAASFTGLQQVSGNAAAINMDTENRTGLDPSETPSNFSGHLALGAGDNVGVLPMMDPTANKKSNSLLEALLIPHVFGQRRAKGKHGQYEPFELNKLSGGDEIVACAPLSPDKHMKFSYNRRDCTPGLLIHRIPLAHPRDAHIVMRLLRQQIMFNKLFLSCFSVSGTIAPTSMTELEQPVEVVVCDAPRFMHLGAYDPTEDSVLGVAVSIERDGRIDARIRGPGGKSHPCSDAKASKLFQVTQNVPLALQAIRSIGQQANMDTLPLDIDLGGS